MNARLEVLDIIDEFEDMWDLTDPYPGNPYDGNLFPQYYSDHHAVAFRFTVPGADDD